MIIEKLIKAINKKHNPNYPGHLRVVGLQYKDIQGLIERARELPIQICTVENENRMGWAAKVRNSGVPTCFLFHEQCPPASYFTSTTDLVTILGN